jgi:hypothetical protein
MVKLWWRVYARWFLDTTNRYEENFHFFEIYFCRAAWSGEEGVVCLRASAAKAAGVFVVGGGTAEAVFLNKTCRDRAR